MHLCSRPIRQRMASLLSRARRKVALAPGSHRSRRASEQEREDQDAALSHDSRRFGGREREAGGAQNRLGLSDLGNKPEVTQPTGQEAGGRLRKAGLSGSKPALPHPPCSVLEPLRTEKWGSKNPKGI
uniref:Uncharacterized protein n=1 Tax=Rangifer tarandus platyrhynchus TaxID=3082113 RepID=A0ACB0F4M2_RANTA|nr:unnamed protein product [Rangifer tarandus platyrhynchus]